MSDDGADLLPDDETVRVLIPRPHAGQFRVLANAQRFNVIRCGRRWGKTALACIIIEKTATLGVASIGGNWQPAKDVPPRIGYFTPEIKRIDEVWGQLRRVLAPVIVQADNTKYHIDLAGGATIDCFTISDDEDKGRGFKFTDLIIDEAGISRILRALWNRNLRQTLIDYRGRAWFLSTSKAEFPYFNTLFQRGTAGSPGWASFQCPTWDNPHLPREELEEIRAAVERGEMPQWMFDEEIAGGASQGNWQVFDAGILAAYKLRHCVPAWVEGHIEFVSPDRHQQDQAVARCDVSAVRFREEPGRGPWKLWLEPVPGRRGVRPDQATEYGMAADISQGRGASNSVLSVGDALTRTKVAEMVSPRVLPEELARMAAAAGLWFGGRSRWALINFERNGPGETFRDKLIESGYPMIARQEVEGTARDHRTVHYGWWSTVQAKQTLLNDYRAALACDRFINPSAAAVDECLNFVRDEYGRYEYAALEDEEIDEAGAKAPHGDRPTADALLWKTLQDFRPPKPVEPVPPAFSPAALERVRVERAKADRPALDDERW